MGKENIIRHNLRLNMDNKHHAMINGIIMGLDPGIYKSRNHFIVDALDFYIENVGRETLAAPGGIQYATKEELAEARREAVAAAVSGAKDEVIRLLAGAAYGGGRTVAAAQPSQTAEDGGNGIAENDDIVMGNAMKWFGEE